MNLSLVLVLALAAQAGGSAAPPAAAAAPAPAAAPSPEEAAYTRGVQALQARDAKAAIAALSECVQLAPTRVDCRWELGWAYRIAERWEEALAQWTEVQRLAPEHPDLEDALTQARGQAALKARLAKESRADGQAEGKAGKKGRTARRSPTKEALEARVRIRAVGDVMLGTDYPEPALLPPDGGEGGLAAVRSLLEDADLTFANLEGPFCDGGTTTKCRKGGNCYAFRTPTSYGRFIKEAGVDVASTANNHSGDFGELCRRQTEAMLDTLGIAWSGPPGSVATVERNGLRIALVAFHTSPSCNHLNDIPTAAALVRSAAREHDLVLVSFHGGAEGSKALHVPRGPEKFYGEDRGDLRAFTHAVVDAGADLVLGHGPHVARGMELYKERLIVYSMGNFATYGPFNLKGPQGLGMVVEVELEGSGRLLTGRILPTRQEGRGIPVPDPQGQVIALVRQLTAEDFPEHGAPISEDGTIAPPKAAATATEER